MSQRPLAAVALLALVGGGWLLFGGPEGTDDAPRPATGQEGAPDTGPGLRGSAGTSRGASRTPDAGTKAEEADPSGMREGPRTATLLISGPAGPLPGARVVLAFNAGRRTRVAHADGRGIVMFGFGPWDVVEVDVRLRGFRPAREEFRLDLVAHTGEDPHAEVKLRPGVPLSGRIVDAKAGQPIAGAAVNVQDGGTDFDVGPTDAEGHFSHPGLKNDGESQVLITAESYVEGWVTLRVDSGRVAPESPESPEIGLVPACRIVGRVMTPDGAPLKDAEVRAWPIAYPYFFDRKAELAAHRAWRHRYPFAGALPPLGDARRVSVTTDAHGHYVLEGLAPAHPHTVRAFRLGYAPSALRKGVYFDDGGGTLKLDFTVHRGAVVTVTMAVQAENRQTFMSG